MSNNIPIIPGIARFSGNARTYSGEKNSILTADLKREVFERDGNLCQCCGFYSEKYQEILFLDKDSDKPAVDSMATCCIFCHQCFNLDDVSVMRSGVLVWLPEIKQAALHHVARAVYVARISQGPVADAARRVLDVLMSRRSEVQRRLGTDDPFILATVLKDYITEKAYDARREKLEGIRLFPLDRRIIKESDLEFNQFPQILAYWRSKSGPFGGRVPREWTGIYKNLTDVQLV